MNVTGRIIVVRASIEHTDLHIFTFKSDCNVYLMWECDHGVVITVMYTTYVCTYAAIVLG